MKNWTRSQRNFGYVGKWWWLVHFLIKVFGNSVSIINWTLSARIEVSSNFDMCDNGFITILYFVRPITILYLIRPITILYFLRPTLFYILLNPLNQQIRYMEWKCIILLNESIWVSSLTPARLFCLPTKLVKCILKLQRVLCCNTMSAKVARQRKSVTSSRKMQFLTFLFLILMQYIPFAVLLSIKVNGFSMYATYQKKEKKMKDALTRVKAMFYLFKTTPFQ